MTSQGVLSHLVYLLRTELIIIVSDVRNLTPLVKLRSQFAVCKTGKRGPF